MRRDLAAAPEKIARNGLKIIQGTPTVVTLSRITNEREAIYRAVCDHEVDGDADLSSVVASVISVIG